MNTLAALLALLWPALVTGAIAAPPAGPPLYFQDPDGKPFYAAEPHRTSDGRDYTPVFVDPPNAQSAPAPEATAPASSSPPDRGRILYYRNPMGLPDRSPVPKKDAMGMDYLPVYENEAADAGAGVVTIAPGRMQVLGVRTAAVESRPALERTIRAVGIVQFDERHLATVTTKAAGWIEHLEVSATGDPVRRGQVMAEIYAPELVAAEEEYLVAARLAGSHAGATGMGHGGLDTLIAASLRRLRALDIAEEEITRLRRTGVVSHRIAVRAPVDGVVIEKPVQEGMRIEAGEPLYKTADLSTVWLIAEVPEQDLGAVSRGGEAKAGFVAFPGRSFSGTIDFIYPALSTETRTARVRIAMPNPDLLLRAGMYAQVEIAARLPPVAGKSAAIPVSALIDNGTDQFVLIERGQGRFQPRKVRIGASGDGYVQVLDGVDAGERVVTGANFLIDSESNLRAALQSFAADTGGPAASDGKTTQR